MIDERTSACSNLLIATSVSLSAIVCDVVHLTGILSYGNVTVKE